MEEETTPKLLDYEGLEYYHSGIMDKINGLFEVATNSEIEDIVSGRPSGIYIDLTDGNWTQGTDMWWSDNEPDVIDPFLECTYYYAEEGTFACEIFTGDADLMGYCDIISDVEAEFYIEGEPPMYHLEYTDIEVDN